MFCPRCGGIHCSTDLQSVPLRRPTTHGSVLITHHGRCPVTGEPILVATQVADPDPKPSTSYLGIDFAGYLLSPIYF
jgi:hypothetical protein